MILNLFRVLINFLKEAGDAAGLEVSSSDDDSGFVTLTTMLLVQQYCFILLGCYSVYKSNVVYIELYLIISMCNLGRL